MGHYGFLNTRFQHKSLHFDNRNSKVYVQNICIK